MVTFVFSLSFSFWCDATLEWSLISFHIWYDAQCEIYGFYWFQMVQNGKKINHKVEFSLLSNFAVLIPVFLFGLKTHSELLCIRYLMHISLWFTPTSSFWAAASQKKEAKIALSLSTILDQMMSKLSMIINWSEASKERGHTQFLIKGGWKVQLI